MVLRTNLRSAWQREPQVILAVDGDVGNRAAPHGFVELGHCFRQFLQSIDEAVKFAFADAALPYLRCHTVAFRLCCLISDDRSVVPGIVLFLILRHPGVLGNKLLHGVGVPVEPLVQLPQPGHSKDRFVFRLTCGMEIEV